MPAPLVLADDDAAVVERYLTAMRAADRRTGSSTTRAARTCQTRIRRGGGWKNLSSARPARRRCARRSRAAGGFAGSV
jgi:hypothetical protein